MFLRFKSQIHSVLKIGFLTTSDNNLLWKITFDGGQPFEVDDLRWKMTVGGRKAGRQAGW